MSSASDRVAPAPVVDATEELLRLLSVSASTGALEVADDVSGTVYLTRGRISFVEASGVPDLGTRLIRAGVVPEQEWRVATARAGAELSGPAVAARHDLIASPSSREIVLSAMLDAAAALMPGTGSGTCRFHQGRRHWAAGVVSLDPEAMLERLHQARLEAEPVSGQDVPGLRAVRPGDGVVLDLTDWPLLDRIDGRTTIAQIARRDGIEMLALSAGVARLIRSGLCAVRGRSDGPMPDDPPAPTPSAARVVAPQTPARLREDGSAKSPSAKSPSARSPSARSPSERSVPERSVDGPDVLAGQLGPLPRRNRGASLPESDQAVLRRTTALPPRDPVPAHDRQFATAAAPRARTPVVGSGRFVSPKDPALLQRLLDGLRRLD